MKIGRNKPCPCGNGKKFKHCHGRGQTHFLPIGAAVIQAQNEAAARERIRERQQGLGRPIIAAKVEGQQLVAVGRKLHWSASWKTFPDFLSDYVKKKLGSEWGNAEIGKPLAQRHPVMQWYDALCHFQQKAMVKPGEANDVPVNGLIACYFTVAYGLYLLEHNVELQERLLARLKNPGNFQGAYYELIVASTFILAGFKLTLEDEDDNATKHCEFAAVSPATGKRYWVEAKMRGVVGELGRTAADGTISPNPLSSMIKQLNAALAKPAADERMIFLDLNAPMAADVDDQNRPPFVAAATRRLLAYEQRDLKAGDKAYVFITNAAFHKDLEAQARLAVMPFGLGIHDFLRAGRYRLSERYLADQRHADALSVAEGFGKLLSFPSTFDGSLPSVTLKGATPPVTIGQTYTLNKAGPNGEDLTGIVTAATVMEPRKEVMIGISVGDRAVVATEPMTDDQYADYKAHPDAYFGAVLPVSKRVETPEAMFHFLMDSFKGMTRDELLAKLDGKVPNADALEVNHLRAIYAEGLVTASGAFPIVDGIMMPASQSDRAASPNVAGPAKPGKAAPA